MTRPGSPASFDAQAAGFDFGGERFGERFQGKGSGRPWCSLTPVAGTSSSVRSRAKRLLDEIAAAGIGIARVTLHVGIGTFKPVSVEKVEDHRMDPPNRCRTGAW